VPERVELRPGGITILAILEVLGGLVFLVLGIIVLAVAGFLPFPVWLGGLIGVIGGVVIIIGIINFVVAYGYWNGSGWAWTVGMAFAILGIVIGLITLPGGILRIVLDGLVIYYLTRPYVKRFFGKEAVTI
jgi:hypothetical protein